MPVKTFTQQQKNVRLTEHFVVEDFWADPMLGQIRLDAGLAAVWEKFAERFGKKPRLRNAFNRGGLVSAGRYAPERSAGYRVSSGGGASGSQHLYGRAVDFEIPGIPAWELAKFAERLPEVGGIGLYHNAGERDVCAHIHIDTRGYRARWGWRGLYSNGGRLVGFGGTPAAFKTRSQGAGVEAIQAFLKKEGYPIAADGEFGPKTASALADWQNRRGLRPDGVYGRLTNAEAKVFEW